MGLAEFFLPRNAQSRTGMTKLGGSRPRRGLGRCRFCPETATHESSNKIPVCRGHANSLR